MSGIVLEGKRLLSLPATVVYPDHSVTAPCVVYNISDTGAHVAMTKGDLVPDRVSLWLTPDGKVMRSCKVLSRTFCGLHVEFEKGPSP
jgi:hypothetical protein